MLKVYVIIAILAVSAALGGGAIWYYNTTQAQIMQLTENNATLKSNVSRITEINEQNVLTIESLEQSFKDVQKDYNKILSDLQETRRTNAELRDRLGKHDIGALAEAKPVLVERVINNASKNAFRCMELLSGSPLNENERNAKNAKSFNSECPWLFKDNSDNTDVK